MLSEATLQLEEEIITPSTENTQQARVSDKDIVPLVPDLSRVIAHYFKTIDEREEVLQGLLTHLLIKLPGYKYKSPLAHWALKIASNYCISHIRRAKIRHFFSLDAVVYNDIESNQNRPHEELTKNENIQLMQDAIEQMSAKDRELILLSEIMQKSDKEVASILNISHTNLRVKKHRSRTKLKEILIKMGYQHEE
jgi:RNA polymerase sigma-70 factor, ECF subfamily